VLTPRLADQYAHHYHLLVSILKGVVLYAAATSILSIYGSHTAASVKTVATMFWAAGLISMVANYDGIMVGSLIITRPPNIVDVVMPFFLGVAEYSHFAVLSPLSDDGVSGAASTSAQLSHLTWWPLLFGIFTLIACIEITASKRASLESARMNPDTADLHHLYRDSLTGGQRFTAVCSTLLFVGFVVLRTGLPGDVGPALDTLRRWQGVLAVIVTFGSVAGLLGTEAVRRRIMTSLAGARS
jgi:hypothetical protein